MNALFDQEIAPSSKAPSVVVKEKLLRGDVVSSTRADDDDVETGGRKKAHQRREREPEELARTVFVGNVPVGCKQATLKQLLLPYGKILSLRFRSIAFSKVPARREPCRHSRATALLSRCRAKWPFKRAPFIPSARRTTPMWCSPLPTRPAPRARPTTASSRSTRSACGWPRKPRCPTAARCLSAICRSCSKKKTSANTLP